MYVEPINTMNEIKQLYCRDEICK